MLLHNNTCISVCGCRRRRNAKKTRGITILANVRLNTQRCTVTTKHNHDNMFVVVRDKKGWTQRVGLANVISKRVVPWYQGLNQVR